MDYNSSLFRNDQGKDMCGVTYKTYLLKRKILFWLANRGEMTVAELVRCLNVSSPTVSKLIADLIAEGYVRDMGKIETPGGRRPCSYGLISEAGYFMGVCIEEQALNIGLIDINRTPVTTRKQIAFSIQNDTNTLNALTAKIDEYITEIGIDKNRILGLGLIFRGRVDSANSYSYSLLDFDDRPLAQIMQQKIGIPTIVENDTRAMAYAEYMNGETNSEQNALFINIGRGIGAGIVIGGKLYYGKSGFAGEFGHIPCFDNEIICHCGKKGCLETEVSGIALESKFKKRLEQGASSILSNKFNSGKAVTLVDIIDAAKKDDVLSIDLITEIGEKLGRGIGVLINLFNPELVVIGGLLSEAGDHLMLPIRTALNKYSLSLVNKDSSLRLSTLGEAASVLGGALLTRNSMLDIC